MQITSIQEKSTLIPCLFTLVYGRSIYSFYSLIATKVLVNMGPVQNIAKILRISITAFCRCDHPYGVITKKYLMQL